jgi:hypothetical protein
MKTLLFCAALLCSGAVLADELADGDALFAKKAYLEALQKYTKLANAGNVTAQQHVGEMYFYGEAGAIDMDKAAQWFRKAAAKGNAVAIASLDLMKQRDARRADLDYWMTKYDGSDLITGPYRCPAPRFPSMSKVNEEIDRYSAKMKERIPDDVAKLLTKDEMDKATAHLTEVGQRISEDILVSGKLVVADFTVWRSGTEAYVNEHNEMVKNAPPPDDDAPTRK